ncbi:MAG: hypothetical protein WC633_04560 [Desulfurivibrionaceae bacterium]
MNTSPSHRSWLPLTIAFCLVGATAHGAEYPNIDCIDPGKNDSAQVIGKPGERLYIHPVHPQRCESPDSGECAPKSYIITGDSVSVRVTCGSWTMVDYRNKKYGQTVGWVKKSRLNIQEAPRGQHSFVHAAHLKACQTVADHANQGTLDQLQVSKQEKDINDEEAKNIFGEDLLFGAVSLWRLDLDNDHTPEYVAITTEGTARVDSLFVRSKKKGAEVQTLSTVEDGDFDITFLKVGKHYYFVSGYNSYGDISMSSMWRYDTNSGLTSVCNFKQFEKPIVEMVTGGGTPVCMAAVANTIKHLDYPLMHAIGDSKDRERFWSQHPLEGLARVDINNDGRPDNVVQVDFTHGGGRGCGVTYLAVADDTRTNIPKTKLNDLLLETLGGYPCGPNMKMFTHGGTSYLDASGAGNRTIYRINGEEAETICEFTGRWRNIVDGSPEDKK